MTPDERAQLDAYAIRFGMDSEDVDEALARVGGDAATLHMARAAVTAYALRRDMSAGRVYHAVIPAARAVVSAWRAGDQDALDSALADLESALLLLDIDAIREE
jgi:hypothetical protein